MERRQRPGCWPLPEALTAANHALQLISKPYTQAEALRRKSFVAGGRVAPRGAEWNRAWSETMTVSLAGVAEFEQSGEGVLPAELAGSLIHLLECAKRHLDQDREKAKASIARAASLLQVEFERRNADADEGPSQGSLVAWQVNRVRAYIDAHLETSIQIRDLAAVARRSTAYFSRAFKASFAVTPHAFIVGRRLHRAAELMLTSDDPLSQVALACGFADQAHLCKMFKQRHGQSPSVWRRQRRDVSSKAAPSTAGASLREPPLSDIAA
jgi:AraC family transcriptional regulator